ncbi:hypothetical protein MRX96_043088 [Rhipicephalus microplus]
MRTEVVFLLPLLFTVAHGGGTYREEKVLAGYRPDDKGNPNDNSPCKVRRGKENCIFDKHGWHYNWFYRVCFMDHSTHCGFGANKFDSCEKCMETCSVPVCAEKVPPPASWELPFKLGGV